MGKSFRIVLCCFIMIASFLTGCSYGAQSLNNNVKNSDNNNYDKDMIDPVVDKDKIKPKVIDANSGFAFNIFRLLNSEDNGSNIFISPLSISTALSMVYQGANSTTKEAMAKALKYTGIDDETLNESYKNLIPYLMQLDKKVELNISNSLWIRDGQVINDDFLSANKDIFDASVISLDFSDEGAADTINQWISDATKKKIEKMVSSPISRDVIMYVINAIYFKGDWSTQFDTKNTFSSEFHSEDGKSTDIMMMRRNGKVEYGQGDDFKAVRLPYGSGKTAMYCILPGNSASVNDFITDLDIEKWNEIKDSISEKNDVVLQLPRFKLEYGIKDLKGSLASLGMAEAFSDKADFSGIRDDITISSVLHKAVIEVDEKGSEAAAATVVEMRGTSVSEPITFIADRPFVFLIADDETGTILFMGKVSEIN